MPDSSHRSPHFGFIFAILAAIFLSGVPLVLVDNSRGCMRRSRAMVARSMISQLAQAAAAYELDYAVYPPGDGTGSVFMAKCIQEKGAKKLPYYELSSDSLDSRGNLLTPFGDGKVYCYRAPGVQNPKSFDLWCEDEEGRADGINNWEK
jgi:hypothetical protein